MVGSAGDLSSTSDELEAAASTWPELYHLSGARANVLRALSWPEGASALEIGAGCGAITRFLGERCPVVHAYEPVPERAAVAAARTRDLPGVEVLVGGASDVDPERRYDVVALVGVLEYAGEGGGDPEPYAGLLSEAARHLAPGGTVVIAIENRLGVKYLAGAPEDHSGHPFDSTEGYRRRAPARTFSRPELGRLCCAAGLPVTRFLTAFPDYKLARAVMADELYETEPSMAWRIPRFPSPDWQGGRWRVCDEGALWRTLVDAGIGPETGNSFVVLASAAAPSSLWPAGRLAAYFQPGWRSRFAAETVLEADREGLRVERRPLPEAAARWPAAGREGGIGVALRSGPFVPGRDLLFALSEGSQTEAVALLAAWVTLVDERLRSGFPAVYDLLPHNVVVTGDGSLVDVDAKWIVPGTGREQVLRRAALVTGERLSQLIDPDRWPVSTTRDLVALLGSLVGLPAEGGWIERAVAEEARFQASVMVGVPAISATVDVVGALARGLSQMIERPVVLPGLGSAPRGDTRLEAEITRLAASLRQSEASLSDASSRASAALAELAAARAAIEGARKERDSALAELAALRSSTSWRLTGLLRAAADSLGFSRRRVPRP